jgi:hypothetical protein
VNDSSFSSFYAWSHERGLRRPDFETPGARFRVFVVLGPDDPPRDPSFLLAPNLKRASLEKENLIHSDPAPGAIAPHQKLNLLAGLTIGFKWVMRDVSVMRCHGHETREVSSAPARREKEYFF